MDDNNSIPTSFKNTILYAGNLTEGTAQKLVVKCLIEFVSLFNTSGLLTGTLTDQLSNIRIRFT